MCVKGHKIRNPNVCTTLTCKQLISHHRFILTGCPLQNSLTDLWSLFDFIYPTKLGTLPVFETEFVQPINLGGYSHANSLQTEQAIVCAQLLKDMIEPYILRRTKEEVNINIPKKTEQVLFCQLTDKQMKEYKNVIHLYNKNIYLVSNEYRKNSKGCTFRIISALKKICNHPDLLFISSEKSKMRYNSLPSDYGNIERSSKLKVLQLILKEWFIAKHKVLIFSQTKQFLDIVQNFIKCESENYTFLRMDGSTPVKNRAQIITQFNSDSSIFIMLLTARAGGLGINLVGADRVIILDPDWVCF